MLLIATEHELRHLLGPHRNAIDFDVGQLRLGDFIDTAVDGREFHMCPLNGALEGSNLLPDDLRI